MFSCSFTNSRVIHSNTFNKELLNIKGVYYCEFDWGYHLQFIYKNGVVLSMAGNSDKSQTLDLQFRQIVKGWKESKYQENRYLWGAVEVANGGIFINRWQAGGLGPTYIKTEKGKILSKESFVIFSISGNELEKYETYKFHPYSPKPDSTNSFIEDLE